MIVEQSYAQLGDAFSQAQHPTPVACPQWIRRNDPLAEALGIDPAWLASDRALLTLSGNAVLEGTTPIATAYAGHQFGHWNPQLGDGRAILIGELVAQNGHRFDLQLKGAGRTPFSRGGDGRSPLGPVLREYIVSEAMHALGVPSTRALAAINTGEMVIRERSLPGAILTRVASSHLRIGTVQYIASRGDIDALKSLIDYCIARHYPEAKTANCPATGLLKSVLKAQARLIAKWQCLGFIHGVMNTDNMLLCGETVDYGPCAFMEAFNPATVYSSIDQHGRYAFSQQPGIAHWNLAMLAQALLPACEGSEQNALNEVQNIIDSFPGEFTEHYHHGALTKLGLDGSDENDLTLLHDFQQLLLDNQCDYTNAHIRLTALASPQVAFSGPSERLFEFPCAFNPWLERWQNRLAKEKNNVANLQRMQQANPLIIPRNHRIEAAINAAETGDFQRFNELADATCKPFEYDTNYWQYSAAATDKESVTATFCGT